MLHATFGQPKQFAIGLGEVLSENGAMRQVDVWAADRWLTSDDNHIFVPQFVRSLQHAARALLFNPQYCPARPYPELSVEDNYRKLRADAETDNSEFLRYQFMDWGPTADNVLMRLFRENGVAHLPFSFWRSDHHAPAELGKVFVAELPESELAAVLYDAAWQILWDWRHAAGS